MKIICQTHGEVEVFLDQNATAWCVLCRDEMIAVALKDPKVRAQLAEAMRPQTVSMSMSGPSDEERARYLDRTREHHTLPSKPHLPYDITALGWEVASSTSWEEDGQPVHHWLFHRVSETVKGQGPTPEAALNEVRWQLTWENDRVNARGALTKCTECGVNPEPSYGGWCPDCACGAESGCPAKYGQEGEPCTYEWCPHGGTSPSDEY